MGTCREVLNRLYEVAIFRLNNQFQKEDVSQTLLIIKQILRERIKAMRFDTDRLYGSGRLKNEEEFANQVLADVEQVIETL